MPVGICRLHVEETELRESHLIPRAIYKVVRSPGDSNPNPVLITEEAKIRTQYQVKDYAFCDTCEQLLNDRGERWVIENSWRSEKSFPMFDTIAAATPTYADRTLKEYSGTAAGLDIEKLIHFGAGIFWRAAAHTWMPVEGQQPPKLELGPYEEQLRRFVLGQDPFPEHLALTVAVSSNKSVLLNERFTFPDLKGRGAQYRHYKFTIPGLYFDLLVGKVLPPGAKHVCIARTGLIFISKLNEEQSLYGFWKLQQKTAPLPPVKPKR
jgi:hypothetical protein